MAGYHIRKIYRGVLGEASKIREEFEEFEDALAQNVKIMALLELSDMLGAIEAYARCEFKMSLYDLMAMNERTKAAFADGTRVTKK